MNRFRLESRVASGFSLVEVVLALGVVTFCLLAVIGLLAVGINASRESIEDNRAGMIAQDAVSRLSAVLAADSPPLPYAGTYFYDQEGLIADDVTKQCWQAEITVRPIASTEYSHLNTSETQLVSATVEIRWPVVNGVSAPSTAQRSAKFTLYLPASW